MRGGERINRKEGVHVESEEEMEKRVGEKNREGRESGWRKVRDGGRVERKEGSHIEREGERRKACVFRI